MGNGRSRFVRGMIGIATGLTLAGAALGANRDAVPGPATMGEIPFKSGPVQTQTRSADEIRAALVASAGRHVVVQFDRALAPGQREALAAAGVAPLGYVGDNAYFAAVADGFAKTTALPAEPVIRDVLDVRREWKLHQAIQSGILPSWMVIPPDEPGADDQAPEITPDSQVAVYVMFHPDVPLRTDGMAAALRNSATVMGRLYTVNALVIELPLAAVYALADEDEVMWIEPPLPPLQAVNNSNRARVGADVVQAAPYALDGTGVTVLVYDAGTAASNHPDFGGRLTTHDNSGTIDHATHVSGTIGGSGQASGGNFKGMAPGVTIRSYGLQQQGGLHQGFLYNDPCDIEADYGQAINVNGAEIANNSIGTNTSSNGYPCEWEGDYGVTDTVIDAIVRGSLSSGEPFRIVWANGNERQSSRCFNPPGNPYHTTAPPACAKNHITVGALNSNNDTMTGFSSFGPADDGRMKPDISAPGCQSDGDFGVTSCTAGGGYASFCGTSMASPTVCGLSALLLQDFRAHFPARPDFRNSTLKILWAHTAVDLGNPGPDYQFGYGSVRVQAAVDFLRTGYFLENEILQGQTYTALVVVNPGETSVKVTLAWDDPPGTPNVSPALVNDLDVRVIAPSSAIFLPWTLDPANPATNAVRTAANHRDNIEQVLIDNATPGVYLVEIVGFNVPTGPQPFSLAATPRLVDCSNRGIITLDRPFYACEGSAVIQVNDCDLNTSNAVVDTVNVQATSGSEPAGETILLTETGPATALFRGTVTLSGTNAPGVLMFSAGDTLTATYIDADDGQGGHDVPVSINAASECIPPVITNVQLEAVSARRATISFDTNEGATGSIIYGFSCGDRPETFEVTGLRTAHEIEVTGLEDNSNYFFCVGARDAAGNVSINDNAGVCYTFATLPVPDFFTENFGGDFDLDNSSVTFVPNGGFDFYQACAESRPLFPSDPTGGTVISPSDNTPAAVSLSGGAQVRLYGSAYSFVWVNPNGNLTFGTGNGDSDPSESLSDQFRLARVSALFHDLNPSAGGTVSWRQLADRLAVTWQNVPENGGPGQNSFQIEMFFDGVIRITWLGIDATNGIVGLSGGGGLSLDFAETNLSAVGDCGPRPPNTQNQAVRIAHNSIADIHLLGGDDGLPAPPALAFIITELPTHGDLFDPNGARIVAAPYTLLAGGADVTYDPDPHYVGSDTFRFRANDGGTPPDGGDSNVSTVSVLVDPPLTLIFYDPFPTPQLDRTKWRSVYGATCDSLGLNPPTPPFSARINSYPAGGDNIHSFWINLSSYPEVRLAYFWERTGGGNRPETGDDLRVEYVDANNSWHEIARHPGGGADMNTFVEDTYILPADALHEDFVLRFITSGGGSVADSDDWFVDDVKLFIPGQPVVAGDMNCDEVIDNADIDGFVLALTDAEAYQTAYPDCSIGNADANGDNVVDNADIDAFVELLLG